MAHEDDTIHFKYHDKFLSLCDKYREYTNNLPDHEKDVKTAALVSWVLALECEDYDKLPIFWHKVVATLLLRLRLLRVGATRIENESKQLTEASLNLLLYLWETKSRFYIARHSSNGLPGDVGFDIEECYSELLAIWESL